MLQKWSEGNFTTTTYWKTTRKLPLLYWCSTPVTSQQPLVFLFFCKWGKCFNKLWQTYSTSENKANSNPVSAVIGCSSFLNHCNLTTFLNMLDIQFSLAQMAERHCSFEGFDWSFSTQPHVGDSLTSSWSPTICSISCMKNASTGIGGLLSCIKTGRG